MTQISGTKALLDACVLYPAPVRDLLLHLADNELYLPKWTDEIHQEWTRNLLVNRPDLTVNQLERTIKAMNDAFPDAIVKHYKALTKTIRLPDQNDCHVLAAAIRSQAQIIVTANLKDFPVDYLSQYDITPMHPDRFITDLFEQNTEEVWQAFQSLVANLKNPPKTAWEVIQTLRKTGLNTTADALTTLL